MSYKITITRTEVNPNYETEMKEFRQMSKWDRAMNITESPVKILLEHEALSCELTDEEYKKFKGEIIKIFE